MQVHRSLPTHVTAPALARDALVDLSPAVPPDAAQDLRLLVSELVTNAVKYAGLREEETIDLDVRTRPEHVEVIVRYPEHVGFAPTLPPEPDEASRWGLFLVDRISNRWSVVEAEGRLRMPVSGGGRHEAGGLKGFVILPQSRQRDALESSLALA
jgi:two-component sensor histidine kinase